MNVNAVAAALAQLRDGDCLKHTLVWFLGTGRLASSRRPHRVGYIVSGRQIFPVACCSVSGKVEVFSMGESAYRKVALFYNNWKL